MIKMPSKQKRSARTESRQKATEEVQLRNVLRDLLRPIYSLDCIGVDGQPTVEEWKARRDADYDELYKDPALPYDLITAVKKFRGGAAVSWVTKDGRPATPNDEFALPILEPQQNDGPKGNTEGSGNQNDLDDPFSCSLPKTASEALAMCLRGRLQALRESGPAPVRAGKMIPQSVIARIALDMLGDDTQLSDLFRELLQVDRRSATGDRQYAARHKATWIKAQWEDIGVRTLAEQVGVNASTVTRWMKEPEFHDEVRDRQRFIEGARKNGIWPRDEQGEALAARLRANLAEVRKHFFALIESGQVTLKNSEIKGLKRVVDEMDRYIRWIDEAA
jgi:hypothetical protein